MVRFKDFIAFSYTCARNLLFSMPTTSMLYSFRSSCRFAIPPTTGILQISVPTACPSSTKTQSYCSIACYATIRPKLPAPTSSSFSLDIGNALQLIPDILSGQNLLHSAFYTQTIGIMTCVRFIGHRMYFAFDYKLIVI